MNSTAAIFGRLQAIWPRLDEYLGLAAVFNDRAPDDYLVIQQAPCIVIAVPSEDVDASTLTETIRAITQDVRLYARDKGSTDEIDDLARDVRDLFHLRPDEIVVSGGNCSIATATGPVASPTTDTSLVGRRITLRLHLERN